MGKRTKFKDFRRRVKINRGFTFKEWILILSGVLTGWLVIKIII